MIGFDEGKREQAFQAHCKEVVFLRGPNGFTLDPQLESRRDFNAGYAAGWEAREEAIRSRLELAARACAEIGERREEAGRSVPAWRPPVKSIVIVLVVQALIIGALVYFFTRPAGGKIEAPKVRTEEMKR